MVYIFTLETVPTSSNLVFGVVCSNHDHARKRASELLEQHLGHQAVRVELGRTLVHRIARDEHDGEVALI